MYDVLDSTAAITLDDRRGKELREAKAHMKFMCDLYREQIQEKYCEVRGGNSRN